MRVRFELLNPCMFAGFKTGSYQPLSRVHSLYITGQAGYIEVNGKYKSFIGKIYQYAINYS